MGLVAWMLIVMMMGAGIGRNSDTLKLRELGGFLKGVQAEPSSKILPRENPGMPEGRVVTKCG